jgi:phosphatidylinositol alpha-1,6-mannosyltransferase
VPEIGPRAVLVVARMESSERYKGHDQLLEVWPRVVARVPDARLVFVGSGDDEVRLRSKAASLGLQHQVIFTGFVSSPVRTALYQRAWALAMPSRGEGFGVVYLEAMAQGLPCIGSVHDAARDVIEDGTTGFLVDQSDLGSIADRLCYLLTNDAARRAMGTMARHRTQTRFSYGQFRERFLGLLATCFAESAPAARPAASVLG